MTTSSPSRTCPCGHDRDHHLVSAEGEYSFLGWVILGLGATAEPKRIRFRCRVCDAVFDHTTERARLQRHV